MNHAFEKTSKDLVLYARTGKASKLIECLAALGVEPDVDLGDGWTPLMHAASMGRAASVRALLNCGANHRKITAEGHTPLMHAAFRGALECVELLLAAGAEPNHKDPEGRTALDFAREARRKSVSTRLLTCTEDPWASADTSWLQAYDTDLVASVTSFIDDATSRGERGAVQSFFEDSHLPEWYRRLIASVPLAGITFVASRESQQWFEMGTFMTGSELASFDRRWDCELILAAGVLPVARSDDQRDLWTIKVAGSHESPLGRWDQSGLEVVPAYESFETFLRTIVPGRKSNDERSHP